MKTVEGTSARAALVSSPKPGERIPCFHCGEPCPGNAFTAGDKTFCCQGCVLVHDLLSEKGLGQFYDLNAHPGVKIARAAGRERWAFLDEPSVREKLLDFTDGRLCRVTFHVPAIHCVACVWLLENLFQLAEGIGKSQVNFARREVSITFDGEQIRLSEVAHLLSSIGYEPQLTLGELKKPKQDASRTKLYLQLGIAGFCFGNIMLFSLPLYLGLDSMSGPRFRAIFGYLSLLLALPVLFYSAADYWKSAALSLRQKVLTLDVPIALGLAALYAQSAYEIVSAAGEGYLDSLSGLIFFLLCGRIFQQKTHDRLIFDRDYRSFFPLAVTRRKADQEESVSISNLSVGDRLIIRNAELIPADARLLRGPAFIDYSFVTGESEPVTRKEGDYLYAGGQQIGGLIEVEIVKPVSQSYLTSLWDHEAFRKVADDTLNTLTNRYSRRFTAIVLIVASAAACGWMFAGDSARAIKAFTSVLIVACPCALALAAPFTLGTAQRVLARLQIFLRNSQLLERLARVNSIVFDKTGTLTAGQTGSVTFHSNQGPLTPEEEILVLSLVRHSTHPNSVRLANFFGNRGFPEAVASFLETPGQGIEGRVLDREIWVGSRRFLERYGALVSPPNLAEGTTVFLAIHGKYRGVFLLTSSLRPEADALVRDLAREHEIALLSGDHPRDQAFFRHLFGEGARLHFNQSPLDKLGFIQKLQQEHRTVLMVGDGLNDAGALKQSDIGIAVVEKVGAFSPASDVILAAHQVPNIHRLLKFSRRTVGVVKISFIISAIYNVAGVSIAAAGILSPIICAVLMPLSSATVVIFACSETNRVARSCFSSSSKDFELE